MWRMNQRPQDDSKFELAASFNVMPFETSTPKVSVNVIAAIERRQRERSQPITPLDRLACMVTCG